MAAYLLWQSMTALASVFTPNVGGHQAVLQPLKELSAVGRVPLSCPDYNEFAQKPHAPFSNGALGLPAMRPSPECRTFHSPAAEVSCYRISFRAGASLLMLRQASRKRYDSTPEGL